MHAASAPMPPLFTVGHSNHDMAHFLALLGEHQVSAVVDVRSQPYSQFNPQFNREVLETSLPHHHLHYVFMGRELGARRDERECYVAGQARYDLIARLPLFLQGLDRLRRGAATHRIAIMCSEKDPLTCHRTILICRRLRGDGLSIAHILEDGALEPHERAESRLLELVGLPEADLFHSRDELLDRAYDLQARLIAYVEPAPPGAVETTRRQAL